MEWLAKINEVERKIVSFKLELNSFQVMNLLTIKSLAGNFTFQIDQKKVICGQNKWKFTSVEKDEIEIYPK